MHAVSSAMTTLLNTQSELRVCTVVTVLPVGGAAVRITDADIPVTVKSQVDGNTYTFACTGPAMTVGSYKQALGLQTEKLTLTLACKPGLDAFNGVSWTAAAASGALDNAAVWIEKVIAADLTNPVAGTVLLLRGLASTVKVDRLLVTVDVATYLEPVLAQNFPRNVYQAQCLHTLFDAGCALTKASYAVTGTAQAGSTASSIATALAQADHYFELGTITFTSGALTGLTRTVGTYVGAVIGTIGPFPAAPAVGDGFTAYPGCDKLTSTCLNKFNNLAHNRSYPWLPTPENAL